MIIERLKPELRKTVADALFYKRNMEYYEKCFENIDISDPSLFDELDEYQWLERHYFMYTNLYWRTIDTIRTLVYIWKGKYY